jgi:ubiquinone/menaquinone biosynthesis C-methylase UbiE
MLGYVMRRTKERGIKNIISTQGDARVLPYPEGSFDAAYLTAVFGEIPEQERALSELRRILKPGGRLVVDEVFPDFYMLPFGRFGSGQRRRGCGSSAGSAACSDTSRVPALRDPCLPHALIHRST